MYELPKCTHFSRQGVCIHCLSSSSVFGAGSLCVVSSTIIQMVSRGFTSREFANRSPFATKFANPSDTMSACAPPFSLRGFPTFVGHISSYCCARNFDIVNLNCFTFLSWRIITHILTAFSITFLTHLKNNGNPLLASKVFTFDHLFTYILQTSLTVYQFSTISLTEWPENRKNRCLTSGALQHKQFRPSFSWRSGKNKRKRQKNENI